MNKYLILFIGLLWAALLLVSWSGPASSSNAPASVTVDVPR